MNAGRLMRWRRRAFMLVLLLSGMGLSLPLSAAWSGATAAVPPGQPAPLASSLAAELIAAQLPLWSDPESHAYLPLVSAPERRYSMPMQTTLPWSAVGFIDNGCTGVLIDSTHVLAAAHCFMFDYDFLAPDLTQFRQGDWQPGLKYFPNYNPARANPVPYSFDRVVVGTRVETGTSEYVHSDWGIGHLSQPVPLFEPMPIQPAGLGQYPLAVQYAGYARDATFFPGAPYPQPAPGGYCQYFAGNCWWIPALVVPDCMALNAIDNLISLNSTCPVMGGNSGTPIMWNAGSPATPLWRVTGVIHGGTLAPAAQRYAFAPRQAAGAAVATTNDGAGTSQVFVSDTDGGRVVARSRSGTGAADPFATYGLVPGGAAPSPLGSLAAYKLTNNRPAVLVIGGDGNLWGNQVDTNAQWQTWASLGRPAGVTRLLDVDVAYDSASTNQLYAVSENGVLWTRQRTGTGPYDPWGSWVSLAPPASYARRVTAIRRGDGTQQVFLVTATGGVSTLWQTTASPNASWTAPAAFPAPAQPVRDLDAAWTEDNQVELFAVDTAGSLWTRTQTAISPPAWAAWTAWNLKLYAPASAAPPAVSGIQTLTASRWQEILANGDIVPVVFATDSQGNVYYTTHSRTSGWAAWRSFYQ